MDEEQLEEEMCREKKSSVYTLGVFFFCWWFFF